MVLMSFNSHLPFNLLREEGCRTLGPFIPVEVGNYTEAELDAMIDYYIKSHTNYGDSTSDRPFYRCLKLQRREVAEFKYFCIAIHTIVK